MTLKVFALPPCSNLSGCSYPHGAASALLAEVLRAREFSALTDNWGLDAYRGGGQTRGRNLLPPLSNAGEPSRASAQPTQWKVGRSQKVSAVEGDLEPCWEGELLAQRPRPTHPGLLPPGRAPPPFRAPPRRPGSAPPGWAPPPSRAPAGRQAHRTNLPSESCGSLDLLASLGPISHSELSYRGETGDPLLFVHP